MKRIPGLAVLLLGLLAAAPRAASGSSLEFQGFGPRLGFTINPDQVHVGAQMDFGYFARRLRFQPNVDVGFGDDVTLASINFDTAYLFGARRSSAWIPYLGGGIGINFWDHEHPFGDNSESDVGANLLGGIETGMRQGGRFFTELKLGLADEPDAKFSIGWVFY